MYNLPKAIALIVSSLGSAGITIAEWMRNANAFFAFAGGIIALCTAVMAFKQVRMGIEKAAIDREISRRQLQELLRKGD